MPPNGFGTWNVRPMPRRHRVAASFLVTVAPANRISPEAGARSPAIRPNRLLLPAPFGPTMPISSPAPILSERLSATTTLPKLLQTASSSSRTDETSAPARAVPVTPVPAWPAAGGSGIRRHEVRLDRDARVQRVVHDLHLDWILAPGRLHLPLHAHRRDDANAGRRAGREVDRAAHAGVVHLVQCVRDLSLVVRVADIAERLPGYLEQRIGRAEGLQPLLACAGFVGRGQVGRGHAIQR